MSKYANLIMGGIIILLLIGVLMKNEEIISESEKQSDEVLQTEIEDSSVKGLKSYEKKLRTTDLIFEDENRHIKYYFTGYVDSRMQISAVYIGEGEHKVVNSFYHAYSSELQNFFDSDVKFEIIKNKRSKGIATLKIYNIN